MTYDQIATARGTAKIGAIRWVQRHRLRRQPGNDGMVRILVDPTMLAQTGPPRRSTPTVTSDGAALVEAANRRADKAGKRADAALALAQGTMAQLAEANARADRAEGRVTAIQAGLDVARAEARAAQDAAEAIRKEDDARKARGLLARLRAAARRE